MNENKKKLNLWRIIYPILAFFGIQLIATFFISVFFATKAVVATGSTDTTVILDYITNAIYDNYDLINAII